MFIISSEENLIPDWVIQNFVAQLSATSSQSPGDASAEPGATTPRWERRVLDLLAEELVSQSLGGTKV